MRKIAQRLPALEQISQPHATLRKLIPQQAQVSDRPLDTLLILLHHRRKFGNRPTMLGSHKVFTLLNTLRSSLGRGVFAL